MVIENKHSSYLRPLVGLIAIVFALAAIIVSGGLGIVPLGMLLLLGSYYALRHHVDTIAVSEHQQQLVLTTIKLFAAKTEYFPLQTLEARYEARGGLRIAKYYVLVIYSNKRKIAGMSPKEGFDASQLERLYKAISNREEA